MASNLLIGDLGLMDTTVDISGTAATSYPEYNLSGGNKTDRYERSSAVSADNLVTINAGVLSPASYVYLAGCRMLQESGVDTITIKRHTADNYAAATTVTTLSSFDTATLVGPHGDDYITTFAEASAQYWFVNYSAPVDSAYPHSKLFVGAAFDPGRDPNGPMTVTRMRPNGGRRKALYKFAFSWKGLTYAKAVEMYTRFYRPRRHSPVILFTTSYHPALNDCRVIFGRIVEMTLPPRTEGYCDVSMTFEELL